MEEEEAQNQAHLPQDLEEAAQLEHENHLAALLVKIMDVITDKKTMTIVNKLAAPGALKLIQTLRDAGINMNK